MSTASSSRSSGTTVRQSGLLVQGEYGNERLVFSDQQLCDDLLATIPKLHDAVRRDMGGSTPRQWTQSKDGIEKYELIPLISGDDDLDLVHSVVAKTELRCHMNEVLNVLVNQDSSSYDATMKSLNGKKFSQGDVLFQQRCTLVPGAKSSLASSSRSAVGKQVTQSGLIAVKVATIKPKFSLKFGRNHKRTQKLCLGTFTHKYPTNDRAVHIIKTLPKSVHDQIVASEDRSALRRELDHLAVGFDIQFFPLPGGGSIDQTTRILAHGYASTAASDAFGGEGKKESSGWRDNAMISRRRDAVMNPEARHVLDLLTDSLSQFERVIRRRRLGLQSFVYFPKRYEDPRLIKNCAICFKQFKFYRRDFFCQLCGQMTCGECSKMHEAEVSAGDICMKRVCLMCVGRVDMCVFDDEDIIEALGPLVVNSNEREWYDDDRFHQDFMDDDSSFDPSSSTRDTRSSSDRSSVDQMTTQLYSDDPTQWSLALEKLEHLVSPTAKHGYTYLDEKLQSKSSKANTSKRKPKSLEQKVLQDVEKHVSYSLRANKDKYKPEKLLVAGKTRENVLEFDANKTASPDQPLAPVIDAEKESKRVDFIKKSKLLDPSSDNSALEMIVQVAAKRMGCATGIISVLEREELHIVASFPDKSTGAFPRSEATCSHTFYEEKPMIVNPARDMRFRNMPAMKEGSTKFYAGFPVHASDGSVVAVLCTMDNVAHNKVTVKEYATMESLAQLVSELITPKVGP